METVDIPLSAGHVERRLALVVAFGLVISGWDHLESGGSAIGLACVAAGLLGAVTFRISRHRRGSCAGATRSTGCC